MFNFCIFVFMGYFLQRAFRMIFPKRVKIHRGVIIAQYANPEEIPRKRKTSSVKPVYLPRKNKYDDTGKRCA